jgi:hypothetical protein
MADTEREDPSLTVITDLPTFQTDMYSDVLASRSGFPATFDTASVFSPLRSRSVDFTTGDRQIGTSRDNYGMMAKPRFSTPLDVITHDQEYRPGTVRSHLSNPKTDSVIQRASSDSGRGQSDTSRPSNGPSRHVSFGTNSRGRHDIETFGNAVGARATMPAGGEQYRGDGVHSGGTFSQFSEVDLSNVSDVIMGVQNRQQPNPIRQLPVYNREIPSDPRFHIGEQSLAHDGGEQFQLYTDRVPNTHTSHMHVGVSENYCGTVGPIQSSTRLSETGIAGTGVTGQTQPWEHARNMQTPAEALPYQHQYRTHLGSGVPGPNLSTGNHGGTYTPNYAGNHGVQGFHSGDHTHSSEPYRTCATYAPTSYSEGPHGVHMGNTGQHVVTAPKHHAPKRRETQPDKFDGKVVDWRDYVVHFEQVASWNGWTEGEKAQQLSMSLRGTAQKLLGDLAPEQLHSYGTLKYVLEQRFSPVEREAAYRCEFRARKCQRGESSSDYGYAIRRLGYRAFPCVEHSAREIYVIDQFINGLWDQGLRRHVQFGHPKTLEVAISLAVEYEAFEGGHNLASKPQIARELDYLPSSVKAVKQEVNSDSKSGGDPSLAAIEQLAQLVKEGFTQLSGARPALERKPSRGHVQCYNCHQMGHYSYDCTQGQNRGKNQKSNP